MVFLMQDDVVDEVVARRVAGETLADLRTVRREMQDPGSVRGMIGKQVRAALERHARGTSADSGEQ
jgi:hypothetical protein